MSELDAPLSRFLYVTGQGNARGHTLEAFQKLYAEMKKESASSGSSPIGSVIKATDPQKTCNAELHKIDEHDGISTTADLGIESPPPYENGHFSASDLARRLLKVDKDTPFAGVPPSPPAEPVPSPAEPNTNMEVRLLPGEVVVDDFIVFDRRRVRVQGLSTIPEEDAMNVGVRMPRRRTQRFVIPH